MPQPTGPTLAERDPDAVVEGFLRRTLPSDAWTHEAHLLVCLALLDQGHEADDVVDRLRDLITAYNHRAGVRPGRGAYHETLTRYYVHAVAAARPSPLGRLVDDPTCDRRAPLRHWSSEVLGSVAARTSWVEPDLEPLPWRTGA